MAKKTTQDNWRVEVYPEHTWMRNFDPKEDAEELAKQIKRHVDGIGCLRVECDTKTHCEFCECAWESDFDGPEGPYCCQAAQNEWNEAQAAIAAAKGEA